MKIFRLIASISSAAPRPALAQDFLDRVDESLTLSASHDNVRVRLERTT